MKRSYLLPLGLVILAIALLATSASKGGTEGGVILFIPYLIGSDVFALLGVLSLFGAFISFFLISAHSMAPVREPGIDRVGTNINSRSNANPPRIRGGGMILVGPIPVLFGSDPKATLIAAVLGLVIMIVAIALFIRAI